MIMVVTEEGTVLNDMVNGTTCSQVQDRLREITGKEYNLYHLGSRLTKKQKISMQDKEDFIFAMAVKQQIAEPAINASNQQQVIDELNRQKIKIQPIQDETEGGNNDNHIDRIVFRNGHRLQFRYMQSDKCPSDKLIGKHCAQFVKKYLADDEYNNEILPLEEKQAEIVSDNLEVVVQKLFNN